MERCFFQLMLLVLVFHNAFAYTGDFEYYDYYLNTGNTDAGTAVERAPEVYDDDEICKNTNNDAVDEHGDDCSWYETNSWDCGYYDTENFNSKEMCCICGGGTQQDTVYGEIIFDATKCSNFELNRAVLYEVLEPYFQNTAGIDILKMNDPNMPSGTIGFEIDISTEGLHQHDLIHDFESIKNIIRDAISCADKTGMDLSHFDTFSSETLIEKIEPDEMDTNPGIHSEEIQDLGTDEEEMEEIIIPHEKSYRNLIGGVRNQGNIGSCVAFAADGMHQFYEMRDNDIVEEFSPKYFYYHRRPYYIERGKGGMAPISVGRITKTAGAVSETLYPYEDVKDTEGTDAIPEILKTMGADYARDNYANDRFFKLEPNDYRKEDDFRHAVQSYLAIYGVGIVSVPVYGDQCDFWNKREGTPMGRHSMLMDGYDENGLHIRNSWGQDWCQNGFSSMTWSDAFDRTYGLYFWKKPIDDRMKDKLHVKNIKVQKDCVVEENVAYDEGNLKTVSNVNSAYNCKNLCWETPRCLTWTYKSTTCYIKDKYRYKKRTENGSISGLPCPPDKCTVHERVATGKECLCSGTKCNANQFCYDEKCNDRPGRKVPCRGTFITNTKQRIHGVVPKAHRDFWVFSVYIHPWWKMVAVNQWGRFLGHKYGRHNNWDHARGGSWQWPYYAYVTQYCREYL